MALRTEMINFIRLQSVKKFDQVDRIAQIAVVQKHAHPVDVRIGIKMVDARSVKCAGAANDPVHFVAFLQQQIGQITTILAGDAGNERLLHA